jgi:uncharacterized protein YkwD
MLKSPVVSVETTGMARVASPTTTARSSRPGRRTRRVASLAVGVALLLSACLTPEQQKVLDELNHDRRVHGRSTLPNQSDAQAKAQAWAEKLALEGRIYHSNLTDGINVRWCGLGENVGYGGSIAQIQDAYMASSSHRANVLNPAWNGAGVGHAIGRVNGAWVVFTVQVFIQTC